MILKRPRISAVLEKKYASRSAIALGEKIVQVGNIRTKKQYNGVMKRLMKKYPGTKETSFIHTFIFGKRNYIL